MTKPIDGWRSIACVLGLSLVAITSAAIPTKIGATAGHPRSLDASKMNGNGGKEGEFSIDEFYSIKRSISNTKHRESSSELKKAKEIGEKLHKRLPSAPKFYGHDHYEQSFDDQGRETWTHVGRPVRFGLNILSLRTQC